MKKKQNIKQKWNGELVDFLVCCLGDKELSEICSHPTHPTHVVRELHITGKQISHKGFYHISRALWGSLTDLNINNNRINNKGCKYLSNTRMPRIKQLNLWENMIGSSGIQYLSKAQWLDIRQIKLPANKLGLNSLKHLVQADWPKILAISLKNQTNSGRNYLTVEQSLNLVLSEATTLKYIYLCKLIITVHIILSSLINRQEQSDCGQIISSRTFPRQINCKLFWDNMEKMLPQILIEIISRTYYTSNIKYVSSDHGL